MEKENILAPGSNFKAAQLITETSFGKGDNGQSLEQNFSENHFRNDKSYKASPAGDQEKPKSTNSSLSSKRQSYSPMEFIKNFASMNNRGSMNSKHYQRLKSSSTDSSFESSRNKSNAFEENTEVFESNDVQNRTFVRTSPSIIFEDAGNRDMESSSISDSCKVVKRLSVFQKFRGNEQCYSSEAESDRSINEAEKKESWKQCEVAQTKPNSLDVDSIADTLESLGLKSAKKNFQIARKNKYDDIKSEKEQIEMKQRTSIDSCTSFQSPRSSFDTPPTVTSTHYHLQANASTNKCHMNLDSSISDMLESLNFGSTIKVKKSCSPKTSKNVTVDPKFNDIQNTPKPLGKFLEPIQASSPISLSNRKINLDYVDTINRETTCEKATNSTFNVSYDTEVNSEVRETANTATENQPKNITVMGDKSSISDSPLPNKVEPPQITLNVMKPNKGDLDDIKNISPGNQKEKSFEDELFYQEKLLQKDKELFDKEKTAQSLDHNIQATKREITVKSSSIKEMENLLSLYDKTIRELVSERKTTEVLNSMEREKFVKQNDQLQLDILAAEQARSDVQRKVERNKEVISEMKKKEDKMKNMLSSKEKKLQHATEKYDLLENETQTKVEGANKVMEDCKNSKDSELLRLQTMLRRAEMHVSTLEDTLNQKTAENQTISNMCDELCAQISLKESAK